MNFFLTTIILFISLSAFSQQPGAKQLECGEEIINRDSGTDSVFIFNIPPGQKGNQVFHWSGNNYSFADFAKIYFDDKLIREIWIGNIIYEYEPACKSELEPDKINAQQQQDCIKGPVYWTNEDDIYGKNGGRLEHLADSNGNLVRNMKGSDIAKFMRSYFQNIAGAPFIAKTDSIPGRIYGLYHLEIHVPPEVCQLKIVIGDYYSNSVFDGQLNCPSLDCNDIRIEETPKICGPTLTIPNEKCSEFHTDSMTWTFPNGSRIRGNGIQATESGTYNLEVNYDGYNCVKTQDFQVSLVDIKVESTPANCANAKNGSLTAQGFDGYPPYSYQWDTGQNGPTLDQLSGHSTHQVIVTDALNCQSSQQASVPVKDALKVDIEKYYQPSCYGFDDGSITPQILNGEGRELNYLWSTGSKAQELNNIPAGSYSLTVTDSQGCVASNNFQLFQPKPLSLFANTEAAPCEEGLGLLNFEIEGGTPNYFLSINDQQIDEFTPGTHSIDYPVGDLEIKVEDFNGCQLIHKDQIGAVNKLETRAYYKVVDCEEVFVAQYLDDKKQVIHTVALPGLTHNDIGHLIDIPSYRGCFAPAAKLEQRGPLHPKHFDIYIPNAFSPLAGSGTSSRDKAFYFQSENYVELEVEKFLIFDRWGGKQYEFFNQKMGSQYPNKWAWRGTQGNSNRPDMNNSLQAGLYTYLIKLKCVDRIYSGGVNLLK